jgi:leucyl-tRNA synthetase
MSVERYNARTAEIHWQQAWDAHNAFAVCKDAPQPRFELPVMIPPPAGTLCKDYVRQYTMRDVVARYKRANGFHVQPWIGQSAADAQAGNEAVLKSLGLSIDWRRTAPCRPDAVIEAMNGASVIETVPAETGDIALDDVIDIIDTYGADATRWYVLSDSPPDRDIIWTETGIHGAWRFVQRLWRLINSAAKFSQDAPLSVAFSAPVLNVRKTAHRALAQVSGNIDRSRFNICVARTYAFSRALEAAICNASEPARPDLKIAVREAAEILVQIFHPMMPHLAEECWAALGHKSLLAAQLWPALEADLLMDRAATLPVHINGKKRADVIVARDARNGDIEASVLVLDAVRRALDGKAPKKVIIVPQRIINVVA